MSRRRTQHPHQFFKMGGLITAPSGVTPDLRKYGIEHRNLDTLQLTPSLDSLQQRNQRTINRLLPALELRRQHYLKSESMEAHNGNTALRHSGIG